MLTPITVKTEDFPEEKYWIEHARIIKLEDDARYAISYTSFFEFVPPDFTGNYVKF